MVWVPRVPEGHEAVGPVGHLMGGTAQQNAHTTCPHPLHIWDCLQPPVLWGFLGGRRAHLAASERMVIWGCFLSGCHIITVECFMLDSMKAKRESPVGCATQYSGACGNWCRVGKMVLRGEPPASCLLEKYPSHAALSWGAFSPSVPYPQELFHKPVLWLHSQLPRSPQNCTPREENFSAQPPFLSLPLFSPWRKGYGLCCWPSHLH